MYSSTLLGLIASVILERPTCLACIAAKVNATEVETLRALDAMMRTMRVTAERSGRCRACGSTTGPIYSVPVKQD